jgi:UDP-N-acetylmuramate--alanine ligase
MIFGKFKELFFVGIGGSGMSGIAEILHNLGYRIRGSDSSPGDVTRYLEGLGIDICPKHESSNLGTANVVVISSAVREDNPEVVEARRRGIPVIKRAEMLGELMRLKYSIGIAGTHGKTTTTSMIGRIMADAGLEPTVIVGGIVAGRGSGASLGAGDYFVAEADEFDRSLLSMFPTMAVVTNIEPDHLECYDGMEDLENAFLIYMNRVPFYGLVVYSADDPVLARLNRKIRRASVNFGLSSDADYRAVDIRLSETRSRFTLLRRNQLMGHIHLSVPGEHNVKNALAASAATLELEIPFSTLAESLVSFKGVARRFEIKGIVDDIMVVDDYAHHPTEIAATVAAAKTAFNRRVLVVFQPHLYSRTQRFYAEFAEALKPSDLSFLVDIYPAREEPIEGVTSKIISDYAARHRYSNISYIGAKENAVDMVLKNARSGDIVITMGAGNITQVNRMIIEALGKR